MRHILNDEQEAIFLRRFEKEIRQNGNSICEDWMGGINDFVDMLIASNDTLTYDLRSLVHKMDDVIEKVENENA